MRALDRLRSVYRFKVLPPLLRLVAPTAARMPLELQGRNWLVPTSLLRATDICYSAGVGEEIDLELWLARTFGIEIFLFDPTPRSIAFLERLRTNPPPEAKHIHFQPFGLWKENTTMRFYAPPDPTWVSHSFEYEEGRPFFDASCKRLSTIMRENGHERIDVLKMNIEGAEAAVLDTMLEDGIAPRVLMLTFEGRGAFGKVRHYVHRLRELGLELAGRRVWAFTFVRAEATETRTETRA